MAWVSPLLELHRERGAGILEWERVAVPRLFTTAREEWSAVRATAGMLDLSYRGWIEVTGEDRVRFLHGMVSNDVKALAAGQGCAALLLDAQGHIQAELRVLAETNRLLIETGRSLVERVIKTLERYIIMDEVELADKSEVLTTVALEGRATREVVHSLTRIELDSLPLHSHTPFDVQGITGKIVRSSNCGLSGAEFVVESSRAAELWDVFAKLPGVKPVGIEALNILRMEAGVPWYGFEVTERTLPQEVGLETTAVSFSKGCYLGQEIVERIRSRGEVHRTLAGLLLSSLEKAPTFPTECAADASAGKGGVALTFEGKEVGRMTSAVYSFALERPIALAVLRCEASQPGTRLSFNGATAEVAALPFAKP